MLQLFPSSNQMKHATFLLLSWLQIIVKSMARVTLPYSTRYFEDDAGLSLSAMEGEPVPVSPPSLLLLSLPLP